jgi:hypothetical protein
MPHEQCPMAEVIAGTALDKLLDDFGESKQEVGSVPALQHTTG